MRQSLRLVLKVKPFKIFTAIHTIHFLICSEGRDFIIEPFFECLPYPLPNTTPEEMGRIIHDSEKKKEKDSNYFVWGTLIIMGALIATAVIFWAIFLN